MNLFEKDKTLTETFSKKRMEEWFKTPQLTDMLNKSTEVVEDLLELDIELIHLITELRRKKIIKFKTTSDQPSKQILSDLKSLKDDLSVFKKDLDSLEESMNSNDYLRLRIMFNGLKNKFGLLLSTENKEVSDIEEDISEGMFLSKQIVRKVSSKVAIQIHKDVKLVNFYDEELSSEGPYEFVMFIFHKNFFVGYCIFDDYVPRKLIKNKSSYALVRHKGYVRKAMNLLFEKKEIRVWIEHMQRSSSANKLYDYFIKTGNYFVSDSHKYPGCIELRRRD